MYFLVKWIKFSVKKKQNIKKILEKWPKILEKSGNFVSKEKWEPCINVIKWTRIHSVDDDKLGQIRVISLLQEQYRPEQTKFG